LNSSTSGTPSICLKVEAPTGTTLYEGDSVGMPYGTLGNC
jgi:hypothetical protein